MPGGPACLARVPDSPLRHRRPAIFSPRIRLFQPALALACVLGQALPGQAAPGDLDATFGEGGVAVAPVEPPLALAVDSAGRILTGGFANVTRWLPSGALDSSFGTGGQVRPPESRFQTRHIVVEDDGRILVPWGILADDGTIERTFVLPGIASPLDVVRQPDGTIVVVGGFEPRAGESVLPFVTRLLADGTPDPAFGTGGVVVTDFDPGADDDLWAVALQSDGKIVAAGDTLREDGIILARYLSDGTLDASFGFGGVAPKIGGTHTPRDVLVQPDGTILVGGSFATAPPPALADGVVARFLSDGTLDPTFGSDGLARLSPRDESVSARVVRQTDGKIVVVADVVARLEPDGALDCGFGGGAVALERVRGAAVGLAADGRIVVGGGTRQPTTSMAAVARVVGGDPEPGCGDCLIDPGEECDDGNRNATDACKPDCTLNVCGDGVVHIGVEACDDGARNGLPDSCCSSACTPEPDAKPCDDGLLCTVDDRCTAAVCTGDPRPCPACQACDPVAGCVVAAAPTAACRQSVAPDRSLLVLKVGGGGQPDRLVWRWLRGEETLPSAFGDPTATHAYTFCVYDRSAPAPTLVAAATIPPGGHCGRRSCWRRPRPGRFVYRDTRAGADGVTGLTLQVGLVGRASVVLKQVGADLLPDLPVGLPLLAQLQAANGECWETRHTVEGVRRNDGAILRVRGN